MTTFHLKQPEADTRWKEAFRDVGYTNIVYGEAPTLGYYEAEELINNQFEFPDSKNFLLNKDYQDIGISAVEGNLNGCPAQVVVQHFGGYVPPNYSKEEIEGWQKTLNSLNNIQGGWSKLKEYPEFYEEHKADADKINEIISLRIQRIDSVVATMEKSQWLSDEQILWIKEDEALYKEKESLANKLNSSE